MGSELHRAEEFDVAVGAQANVVGEVEADVIGVFIDYDLVGAPVPIVAEAVVRGPDAEGEAAEPEAFAIAPFDAPDVAGTEAAAKVAVSPGMIDVIVGIVLAGVVADPFAVGVDMRSVGMAGFVDIVSIFDGMSVGFGRRRTMRRRVRWRSFMFFLRESRSGTNERECKYA